MSYLGVETRSILGLKSANFELQKENGTITFKVKGYGHGVGMCQYGADGLGQAGYTYVDILALYYPGTHFGRAADFLVK